MSPPVPTWTDLVAVAGPMGALCLYLGWLARDFVRNACQVMTRDGVRLTIAIEGPRSNALEALSKALEDATDEQRNRLSSTGEGPRR